MAAKSISALDRQAIGSLSHFSTSDSHSMLKKPPLSTRDASIIPKNSRTPWKQEPTPIAIPSNFNSVKMNPYSVGRFKNTLDSNTQDVTYRSRQKQQTMVGPPPKRRKTTHGPPLIANGPQPDTNLDSYEDDTPQAGPSNFFTPAPRKPPNLRNPRNAPKEAPVTMISSDEEVGGTLVAPKESVSGPPDGKNSTWLQEKHARRKSSPSHSNQSVEVEDISEFTDRETQSGTGKPGEPGFVKEQARKLDRKEHANRSNQKVAVPHIDLTTVSNVKGSMKVRSTTKPKSKSNAIDPIATSSTTFVVTKMNSKANDKFKTIPLKEIYFGLKHLGEGYRIVLNPSAKVQGFFIHGPEKYRESVTFAQSVKSMQIGDTNYPKPCIKFTSKPLPHSRRHIGIGQKWGEDFIPGEPGKGEVTLKIDEENPDWSPAVFNTFRLYCKRVLHTECSEVFGLQGNLALWSLAEQAANTHEDDSCMEYAEADSDPLNIIIPTEENSESSEIPVSNERNQGGQGGPSNQAPRMTYTSRKPSFTSENRNSTHGVRRSARQQQNETKQVKKRPTEDPDEIILSYPPDAATGAVKITNGDYSRLLPDEYLNDTLIEFGLKLWLHELAMVDPELANQVHIFSSFFYKKLNKKNLEEGYQSVRRWTSKFDIFSKKFVIVPINESMHWYLAIIYRPDLVLLPPPERELPNTRRHARTSNAHQESMSSISTSADAPSPATATASSNEAEPGSSLSRRRSLSSIAASGSASRPTSPSEASPIIEDSKPSSEADVEETAHGLTAVDIYVDVQIPDLIEDPPSPSTSLSDESIMNVDGKADEKNESPSFSSLVTSSRDPRQPMDLEEDQPDNHAEGVPIPPSHSRPTSVPTSRFYATPARSKKEKERAFNPVDEASDGDTIAANSATRETIGQPTTMIFTLDSLGNKHPRVISTLSRYLQLEAQDKKRLHNTSKALGKPLPVPTQPNFCDCGIYLIHFARVFVQKAEYLSSISQKKGTRSQADRNVDWDGHRLSDFRDELREKVGTLSKCWRADNSPQQQDPEKKVPPNDEVRRIEAVVHDLSDSDIDIVETVPQERKAKLRGSNVARVRGN
ncbi:hypothetical protein DFJ43DRAFT_1155796 [Lentinula guzmanii]|uniref:Ubiquitin-like protease family profile domain-containing protein n=1 Tax=Lentinula guzmanii TaxID=2804957 RepID=A0AA38JG88_9AGAR|nr:hypothetical protein DFJ43DRAFT_1155796 [Lentinula guzmanii]